MDILTYSKIILEKVSFDNGLLEKEYKKFVAQLGEPERLDLEEWFTTNFGRNSRKEAC